MDFLHRADIRAGQAQWVSTSPSRLRQATFLDGREQFWDQARVVDQDFVPDTAKSSPNFLFHFGFCGSTLLAKFLDAPDTALVLREPQSLTDIASQYPALLQEARTGEAAAGIEFTLQSLTRVSSEQVIMKPSNWVNGLLPLLSRRGSAGRALFLTLEQRAFLLAIFRGGRDRLAFCARLSALLADAIQTGPKILQNAIDQTTDPLGQAAMLSAFAYNAQRALFQDAQSTGQWDNILTLDYQNIVDDVPGTVKRCREFFGIAVSKTLDPGIAETHAKDGSQSFSVTKQQTQNAELERLYGNYCTQAADWANRQSFTVAKRA